MKGKPFYVGEILRKTAFFYGEGAICSFSKVLAACSFLIY